MKRIIQIALVLALAVTAPAIAYNVDDGVYPEVHCKHFFYGYPTGTPTTNDLIIRDIYALSSNAPRSSPTGWRTDSTRRR